MSTKQVADTIFERAKEYHKYNWLEEAEKLYRGLLVERPNHPDVHYNLGDIAMRVNKPDVASVYFETALTLRPDCQCFQRALDEARENVQAHAAADNPIETPRIFELTGNDCVFDRRLNSLENKLFLLGDKFNTLHEALIAAGVFDSNQADEAISRVLPLEIVNKNATTTLIAFGGMASGLSMPPKEFFKSLVHKDLNTVFVRDFKQCWYLKGLLGKTHDVESTIEYLKRTIPDTTDKLATLGASAGGYAAIRFGLALNADHIVAFSPQTFIDQETVRVFSKSHLRDMAFDNSDLDLRNVLARYPFKGEIEVHYASKNNRDTIAASHIEKYVKAIPYDTDTHLLAAHLKERGVLNQILESLCER